MSQQNTCRRCGTCCAKGGPALHKADLPLINRLALGDLITIRLGEPVYSPLANGIEPARNELIKFAGQNNSWTCRFFDQANKLCGVYAHRPLECRLLKCWEPEAITKAIYQDCLSREDIVPADDELDNKLWDLIEIQKEYCSFSGVAQMSKKFTEMNEQKILAEIAETVNLDLKIRRLALQVRRLSLAEELLYFGRPMFKSLAFYDLAIEENPQGLTVHPAPSLRT